MDLAQLYGLTERAKDVRDGLVASGEISVMEDGGPASFDVVDGDLRDALKAVRQVRAILAFRSIRAKAAARGFLSDEEIEEEIAAARHGG